MCHTTFYMLLRKTKKDANAKLGVRQVKQYQGDRRKAAGEA